MIVLVGIRHLINPHGAIRHSYDERAGRQPRNGLEWKDQRARSCMLCDHVVRLFTFVRDASSQPSSSDRLSTILELQTVH